MRRSKAPSMYNRSKVLCISTEDQSNLYSNKSIFEFDNQARRQFSPISNYLVNDEINKRIFIVVWRDITAKKHKTWKGDGTLEVYLPSKNAKLRNEHGKYIASCLKINPDDLLPENQLIIDDKEIEIQEEVTNLKGFGESNIPHTLKYPMNGDKNSSEELTKNLNNRKNLHCLKMTSLQLKEPRIQKLSKDCLRDEENKKNFNILKKKTFKEFICCVKCSDLQQYLIEKVNEYCIEHDLTNINEQFQNLEIPQILQHICTHPSHINKMKVDNSLLRLLTSALPDWSEMGPFDSGKLEFVQYFVNNKSYKSTLGINITILISECCETLNMLQDLCDFLNIKCYRFKSNTTENEIISFLHKDINKIKHIVLIMSSHHLLEHLQSHLWIYCSHIIIYDNAYPIMQYMRKITQRNEEIIIYYLITALTIEDVFLWHQISNSKSIFEINLNILQKFFNLWQKANNEKSFQYTDHCNNVLNSIENWKLYHLPLADSLLESLLLEAVVDNLLALFYRN